jgi:hypothetical protein
VKARRHYTAGLAFLQMPSAPSDNSKPVTLDIDYSGISLTEQFILEVLRQDF